MSAMDVPRYCSGEDIHTGDQIDYAGQPGEVVFVLETASFSPEFPQRDWSYLARGFMLRVNGYGLVHLEQADEDLRLVGRQAAAP